MTDIAWKNYEGLLYSDRVYTLIANEQLQFHRNTVRLFCI
jgi:hypothetical protein